MRPRRTSNHLLVDYDQEHRRVEPGGRCVFGRDRVCDIQLDPADTGISRVAGCVEQVGQIWTVTNLSRKRALHVVDPFGFALPLPVALDGGPASRRAVDHPALTVLVPGGLWTYGLRLTQPDTTTDVAPRVLPADPISTVTQAPRLTDRRREVMVALARGYLRPYPHYDPRPRSYQEVADLLGLTGRVVSKRIEHVRDELVAAGVQGLDRTTDARRPLCEWLLAMRLIGPADLDWLAPRLETRRAARTTRNG